MEGTYVVALFDCCREKMTVAEVQQGKKVKVDGRGGGLMEEEPDYSVAKARDLMIVFGCPPNSYTPAESTLTVGFFQTLDDMSDKIDKVVVLPDNATAWKPCNKGEVLSFTHHDLEVPFDASKQPLCLKQNTFTKLTTRVMHVAAKCIATLSRKLLEKKEVTLYNALEGTLLAISPETKRMRSLTPYETFEPYQEFLCC